MNGDRWARIAESGTRGGLRFGGWFHRHFGRRSSLALLGPVCLYYYLRNREARRGSLQYLERIGASPEGCAALGRAPGPRLVLRHFREFAVAAYDRMVVWSGALDSMQVEHDGSEAIFELARNGRGALLLGAHLGSLDMLWFLSRRYDLKVNVVAFYANAERVNAFFESLAPESRVKLIALDPGSVRAGFEVKACIDRGEFVVILADRMAPGKTGRSLETTFLGRRAAFPLSPFLLAGLLGCPVLLSLCLRTGDARYRTVLRPLVPGGFVPRAERDKRAAELLEAYVALLERYCLELPLQWFNFYQFWDADEGEA